jgi:hypothetical protein
VLMMVVLLFTCALSCSCKFACTAIQCFWCMLSAAAASAAC